MWEEVEPNEGDEGRRRRGGGDSQGEVGERKCISKLELILHVK
jgi:hypothetical protein